MLYEFENTLGNIDSLTLNVYMLSVTRNTMEVTASSANYGN